MKEILEERFPGIRFTFRNRNGKLYVTAHMDKEKWKVYHEISDFLKSICEDAYITSGGGGSATYRYKER